VTMENSFDFNSSSEETSINEARAGNAQRGTSINEPDLMQGWPHIRGRDYAAMFWKSCVSRMVH